MSGSSGIAKRRSVSRWPSGRRGAGNPPTGFDQGREAPAGAGEAGVRGRDRGDVALSGSGMNRHLVHANKEGIEYIVVFSRQSRLIGTDNLQYQ